MNVLIQFRDKLNKVVDGSKTLNRLVIIFKKILFYFYFYNYFLKIYKILN
uniref:Uncharacterized protein n=1 Tax=Lotus japonicus TaxID=34305 RepID=I3SQZ9_LOTJA|nr:unknown [Lotus japonicus]